MVTMTITITTLWPKWPQTILATSLQSINKQNPAVSQSDAKDEYRMYHVISVMKPPASTTLFLPTLQRVKLRRAIDAEDCKLRHFGNVFITFTTASTPPITVIRAGLSSSVPIKLLSTIIELSIVFSSTSSFSSVT
jgi:hypothetical protein